MWITPWISYDRRSQTCVAAALAQKFVDLVDGLRRPTGLTQGGLREPLRGKTAIGMTRPDEHPVAGYRREHTAGPVSWSLRRDSVLQLRDKLIPSSQIHTCGRV